MADKIVKFYESTKDFEPKCLEIIIAEIARLEARGWDATKWKQVAKQVQQMTLLIRKLSQTNLIQAAELERIESEQVDLITEQLKESIYGTRI